MHELERTGLSTFGFPDFVQRTCEDLAALPRHQRASLLGAGAARRRRQAADALAALLSLTVPR
eukprot:6211951-Pleurochrysis_carterae.AAC.4